MNNDEQITYFAETDARNKRIRFGIKAKDRTRHVYAIGKTGMGKSTLLESMAIQDIANGNGIAFVDPHGSSADKLLEYVPEHRIKDVIYFAPFDLDYPISFNVMEDVGADKRHLVASGLMSAFKKIWVDAWSARMEYILNNTILALLEYPGATLISINRMLADKDYRKLVVDNVTDPSVKSFWVDEFAKYTDRFASEATPAIQNKIGQFISNPLIRNIIGQPKSSFDIRKAMDERKIVIVNLSKGRMGESNANLLGAMLITKIYLAAMSRADVSSSTLKELPHFYFYVDEFQNFANESFAGILSEARKYKLSLTIAHQYIEQMTDEVRAAVFGNVGTMISYRVGAFDAEVLEKEFAPVFTAEDIVNLGFTQIYLKLMIDGIGSRPFSATTINTPPKPETVFVDQIIAASREQFAQKRSDVEDAIKKWHETNAAANEHSQSNNSGERKQFNNDRPRQDKPRQFNDRPRDNGPRKEIKKETHQPFKIALTAEQQKEKDEAQAEREAGLRNAVSLSFLKARADDDARRVEKEKVKAREESKNPSPQNIASLRDALKDVLKEAMPQVSPQAQVSQPAPSITVTPPKPDPVVSVEQPKQQQKQQPFEISEEELRSILHVDKPE
ncbi:MAG: hypothetical protein RLY57_152 [Candidatus Parcubacteria bacterium]|jgi:energy-coupling factor transporter ATP-binding protein EcfA2